MATEPSRERYVDLPNTNFPETEDSHARMSDVGASTITKVQQFETYYAKKNWTACTNLLRNNPDLENCMFDAEKFNWMRDAIIALQRYFLTTIQNYLDRLGEYIIEVEHTAVGLDDTVSGEASPFTTYSARKIEQMYKVNYHVSDSFVTTWKQRLQQG